MWLWGGLQKIIVGIIVEHGDKAIEKQCDEALI